MGYPTTEYQSHDQVHDFEFGICWERGNHPWDIPNWKKLIWDIRIHESYPGLMKEILH